MIRRFDETPIKNQNYITRHGVYAIIINSKKLLITFQGPPHNEYELPGGGVDVGESHLHALHREALEETGWAINPKLKLGIYQRYTFMPEYDLWARKVCHIYLCHGVIKRSEPLHDDHTPIWTSPKHSFEILYNSGDKYFLKLAMNKGYV